MDRRAFLTQAFGLTGAAAFVLVSNCSADAFSMVQPAPAAGETVSSAILSDGDGGAKIEEAGWGWRRRRWRGRRCWRGRWGHMHCRW